MINVVSDAIEIKVQVSDTTGDAISTAVCIIKFFVTTQPANTVTKTIHSCIPLLEERDRG